MGMADTCRVCLCGRRRLHTISNTLFQEIWEKLTNAKFNTNNGKSPLVCYMCRAQLGKAHQLMKRASEAEKLLTDIVNNECEQSQNALLLIASQKFDLDYEYVIEHQYQLDSNQFQSNTVEEIKEENEGDSEVNNKEWSVINIKEEKEDSSQEDNVDNADIESDTPSDDDTLLKHILQREVRIVLERIDIDASTRKRTLNEAPQKVKRIKLDETTKDRNLLTNTVLESLPENNCTASHKSFTKKSSVDSNVKISKNKRNLKSVVNCINEILPNVNIVPKHNIRVKDVTSGEKNTLTSEVTCNNSENISLKQRLRKSADAGFPSTSLDGSDEGKQSSICNERKGLEKWFSCHLCQYKCVAKSKLDVHLRKHTGEKPYECDLCDFRSSRRNNVESHIKYKHTKEKNFLCHICQYRCVTNSKLVLHLRKHTGEKPYKCNLCDFRFSRRDHLESHMKCKHTKEKNFSCHMCQYQCVRKGNLKVHLRKHTGEKTYECDLCDYRGSRRDNLERHMKYKHTKEKNFLCHICQYKFVTKNTLVLHLRKHTGEKPYKCDFCDFRSSRKGNLESHMKCKHKREELLMSYVSQRSS